MHLQVLVDDKKAPNILSKFNFPFTATISDYPLVFNIVDAFRFRMTLLPGLEDFYFELDCLDICSDI